MTLMFDKSQVEEASHPLVRILRHIFYKKRVTIDEFSTMFIQYGKRLGLASNQINTNRNNARKALNIANNITFAFFMSIVYNVMHLEVVEFSITVIDPETKELVTYKNTDPVESMQKVKPKA